MSSEPDVSISDTMQRQLLLVWFIVHCVAFLSLCNLLHLYYLVLCVVLGIIFIICCILCIYVHFLFSILIF